MAEFCNKCAKKLGLEPDELPLFCEGCGKNFEKKSLLQRLKEFFE